MVGSRDADPGPYATCCRFRNIHSYYAGAQPFLAHPTVPTPTTIADSPSSCHS
jgi:hypothetical protein